jgi:hypothetical protein
MPLQTPLLVSAAHDPLACVPVFRGPPPAASLPHLALTCRLRALVRNAAQ